MTTTRTTQRQDHATRTKDSVTSGDTNNPMKRKREGPKRIKAKCQANQPLIDALQELSTAASHAQAIDYKLRYKSAAIEKAAMALAQLEDEITVGEPLAKGPKKVPGVGTGTAYYIDEFLLKGDISDIHMYNEKSKVESDKLAHRVGRQSAVDAKDQVEINRAPVLTLWVAVVAERQGCTSEEAYTYGRWISGLFAQSKGRSLGIFEPKEEPTVQERASKRRRDESMGVSHVQVFQHVKIPTLLDNDGNRFAVSDGKPLNPNQVQGYLERAFGNNLDAVKQAMIYLAESMTPEELRQRAYHLYEQFRPAWKGWGQKGSLHLSKIRNLAA